MTSARLGLVDKVKAVAAALEAGEVPYAFGGAFALAYATREPRGTRVIDVNVFVAAERAGDVIAALPAGVASAPESLEAARADDQVRLWWDDTPLDIFFAADDFHAEVERRTLEVDFAGRRVRVLAAEDLAVFKALFDRGQDWVDIANMVEVGSLDLDVVAWRLGELLGSDDRIDRLRSLSR